jgi:hypothetical protein
MRLPVREEDRKASHNQYAPARRHTLSTNVYYEDTPTSLIRKTHGRPRPPPAARTGAEKEVRCREDRYLRLIRTGRAAAGERSGRPRLRSARGRRRIDNSMDGKFYLEDLFGRKVDLVMNGVIKKRLKPYILGEVIYA